MGTLLSLKRISMVAMTIVVATVVFSCKEKIPPANDIIDSPSNPTQVIENMVVQQSEKGIMRMRMSAAVMERYERAKDPYDIFPSGINVKIFTPEGMLETEMTAKVAKHFTMGNKEKWEAYGNVVVKNYIKGETMETDTLFWDRANQKIYTHCLVRLQAPDMFMQGMGMESDEMARNAVILNPFDSYGVVQKDSTEVGYIDTVNFIGPLLPKKQK